MLHSSSIAFIGTPELEQVLRQAGFELNHLEIPENLELLGIGANTFLLIIEGHQQSDIRNLELTRTIRAKYPYLDLVIYKPDADIKFVHAALKGGATEILFEHSIEILVLTIKSFLANQSFSPHSFDLRDTRKNLGSFEGILSRNGRMWDIFQTIVRTASSDATVLIVGETGTGKELLARAIHRQCGRNSHFVAINCSTINPEIIESELFGHERGAFTGAHQTKQGLFRYAEGGTIFLDEIGDMPIQTQLSLLRVLQEQTVRPVGSHQELPIDVRVIAATNASLAEAVQEGIFREDLFYRIDVIRLEVPPLRERREDILYLFGHFLRRTCSDYGMNCPDLHPSFVTLLLEQSWPGNVRQLENLTQRLVLNQRAKELTGQHLQDVLYAQDIPNSSPLSPEQAQNQNIPSLASPNEPLPPSTLAVPLTTYLQSHTTTLEKAYLTQILSNTNGRIAEAAQQAGISRRTLLRKLTAHKIDKHQFRTTRSDPEPNI